VALAWLLANPAVTAPIVGVSRKGQITEAVAAVGLWLAADDLAELDEHYVPHKVAGFT
jgi:aryl-alcohol dehydrogenase (NADP+)